MNVGHLPHRGQSSDLTDLTLTLALTSTITVIVTSENTKIRPDLLETRNLTVCVAFFVSSPDSGPEP